MAYRTTVKTLRILVDKPVDAASFRAWRDAMCWTQERTAAELGLTRRSVSGYELGRHQVTRVVGLACNLLAIVHGVREL